MAIEQSPSGGRHTASDGQSSRASQTITSLATARDEAHEIQLRYKISTPTMKPLNSIVTSPDRRQVLEQACHAMEFRSIPIQANETSFFRYINDNTSIPYRLMEPVSEPWHKAFLLVQIDLTGAGWPNKISAQGRKDLYKDRGRIHGLLDRVIKCLIDIMGSRGDGRGVVVGLDVLRSVKAGVWEGGDVELLQVPNIGQAKIETLGKAGVTTIKQLAELEFYHIERILSRNPPFGQNMRQQLRGFPCLMFGLELVGTHAPIGDDRNAKDVPRPNNPWKIVRMTLAYENDDVPNWKEKTPWVTLVLEGEDGRLLWFWRGSVKKLKGSKELIVGLDASQGEKIKVSFACEEIVGTMIRRDVTL